MTNREYGQLVREILQGFELNHKGIHGTAHWMRVRANGLKLGSLNGANMKVVQLFAIFHDSRRLNDGRDPQHGKRGAALAYDFWKSGKISLSGSEFRLLEQACCDHTHGGNRPGDVTVATCWDSDRLDLERVGITPNPRYLCTDEARHPDMLGWAINRSVVWVERHHSYW